MKTTYEPMNSAPKNRSIVARLRDGREIMVCWDKRSRPPRNSYLGTREPGMVEGWCSRENEKTTLFASDLTDWREVHEELLTCCILCHLQQVCWSFAAKKQRQSLSGI